MYIIKYNYSSFTHSYEDQERTKNDYSICRKLFLRRFLNIQLYIYICKLTQGIASYMKKKHK